MARTVFNQAHDLNKLHDEIIAALPGRAGEIVVGDTGIGSEVEIEYPDDLAATILAIVQAHDPTPPPPRRHPDDILADDIDAAGNILQIKQALAAYFRARAVRNS